MVWVECYLKCKERYAQKRAKDARNTYTDDLNPHVNRETTPSTNHRYGRFKAPIKALENYTSMNTKPLDPKWKVMGTEFNKQFKYHNIKDHHTNNFQ